MTYNILYEGLFLLVPSIANKSDSGLPSSYYMTYNILYNTLFLLVTSMDKKSDSGISWSYM